ncbi:MAG: hypothetical protein M1281_14365, partial [Chloroflexi bacterium]|nr:hypothetical protein [Chloroflexota bacterium]
MANNPGVHENSGWTIGQSISMELDTAFFILLGSEYTGDILTDFLPLVRAVPSEWLVEFKQMLGQTARSNSILEAVALWAGVLFDEDYSHATLAMRQLDVETALEHLSQQAVAYQLTPDAALPPIERLVDLTCRFRIALFQNLGIEWISKALTVLRLEV